MFNRKYMFKGFIFQCYFSLLTCKCKCLFFRYKIFSQRHDQPSSIIGCRSWRLRHFGTKELVSLQVSVLFSRCNPSSSLRKKNQSKRPCSNFYVLIPFVYRDRLFFGEFRDSSTTTTVILFSHAPWPRFFPVGRALRILRSGGSMRLGGKQRRVKGRARIQWKATFIWTSMF